MQYLGIDCGRDAIKSIIYKNNSFEKFVYPAKFIDNFDIEMLKNISILNFNTTEHIIARINDGDLCIYGKFCNKLQPDLVQLVISDDRYIEYSKRFVLITIAELIDNDDDVIIGLNLTANNINYKQELRDYFLNNEFNVKLYNNNGKVVKEVNFKIIEVGIWFQGWTSYLNLAIDDNFDVNMDYVKKDVLTIDVGRATIDCVYITELSNAKTMAFNLGTEVLFNRVIDYLYSKYNIKKTTLEISNIIINNKKLLDKNGNEIDLKEIVKDRVNKISNEIYNAIYNNFSNYSYEEVYLTGGGIYFYGEKLKELFKNAIIMEDFVFSNCYGLVKMIVRKFLKGKKGQKVVEIKQEEEDNSRINKNSIFD